MLDIIVGVIAICSDAVHEDLLCQIHSCFVMSPITDSVGKQDIADNRRGIIGGNRERIQRSRHWCAGILVILLWAMNNLVGNVVFS